MDRHVMKSPSLIVLIGTIVALAAPVAGYEWDMVLVESNPIDWYGTPAYEYIYDIYGKAFNDFHLKGFDATRILNLYEGAFWDKWEGWAAGYESWVCGYDPWTYQSPHYPSYGEGDGDDVWWVHPSASEIVENYWGDPAYWPGRGYDPVHAATHGIVNTWHAPSEYAAGAGNSWSGGTVKTEAGGDAYDGLYFPYFTDDSQDWTGSQLEMTLRIIHMDGPNGTIDYDPDGFVGNTVVGPWLVGDFNLDGNVDDLDIDELCDSIRLGMPYEVEYDISADGLSEGEDGIVDLFDLDYLVRFLVETTIGNGTEYGDFNLDGLIDTTDLTRLATNYGCPGPGGCWRWSDGNANRYVDCCIDNTDLTNLATYYGFGEPDVVPEPATLSLLALGASGLLARRRRRA